MFRKFSLLLSFPGLPVFYLDRYCLPKSVKLLFYNSLFLSYVKNCHLVLGTTRQYNVTVLHRLQKHAARIIVNATCDSHSYSIFKDMNLLPMPEYCRTTLLKRYESCLRKSTNFLLHISKLTQKHCQRNLRTFERWKFHWPAQTTAHNFYVTFFPFI